MKAQNNIHNFNAIASMASCAYCMCCCMMNTAEGSGCDMMPE